jgi:hypothetical protein
VGWPGRPREGRVRRNSDCSAGRDGTDSPAGRAARSRHCLFGSRRAEETHRARDGGRAAAGGGDWRRRAARTFLDTCEKAMKKFEQKERPPC